MRSFEEITAQMEPVDAVSKLREMYSIMQNLERYLKMKSLDGKMERQPLRQELKEALEKL